MLLFKADLLARCGGVAPKMAEEALSQVIDQDIKARDATLAQHVMAELWVLLEEDKAKINWGHMRPGKAPTESQWDDLAMQSQLVKIKICDIISKLQHIEGLLTKLSSSNRSKLQASCADPNLVSHGGWAGTIGLVKMLAVRAFGAPRIVIVDADDGRLSVANELDADEIIKVSTNIQVDQNVIFKL
ncbi:hypothetical protein L1987_83855 [Smallanthus sonchifolius]|uniref:Uncharacterized protein n=1 Tax=Smallanthus sonchifolius TaxID=185202 RepID=A0ACB8YD19_9ASTR|nr:hypothetical protein L1987_83855 [Smallanthus sonchifolius]